MYNKAYPTIIYSKESILDKKLIMNFLINYKIHFEPVNNVYKDYEAYIRVHNASPKSRNKRSISPSQNIKENEHKKQSSSPLNDSKKYDQKKRSDNLLETIFRTEKPPKKLLNQLITAFHNLEPKNRIKFETNDFEEEELPVNSNRENNFTNIKIDRKEMHNNMNQKENSLETITDVINYELKNFIEKNTSMLKEESVTEIKDKIKKLCQKTLKEFNLTQDQEKLILNKVMTDFDNIFFTGALESSGDIYEEMLQNPSRAPQSLPSSKTERSQSFGSKLPTESQEKTEKVIGSERSRLKKEIESSQLSKIKNLHYPSPASIGEKLLSSEQILANASTINDNLSKLKQLDSNLNNGGNLLQGYKKKSGDHLHLLLSSEGNNINSALASVNSESNLVLLTGKTTEQDLDDRVRRPTQGSNQSYYKSGTSERNNTELMEAAEKNSIIEYLRQLDPVQLNKLLNSDKIRKEIPQPLLEKIKQITLSQSSQDLEQRINSAQTNNSLKWPDYINPACTPSSSIVQGTLNTNELSKKNDSSDYKKTIQAKNTTYKYSNHSKSSNQSAKITEKLEEHFKRSQLPQKLLSSKIETKSGDNTPSFPFENDESQLKSQRSKRSSFSKKNLEEEALENTEFEYDVNKHNLGPKSVLNITNSSRKEDKEESQTHLQDNNKILPSRTKTDDYWYVRGPIYHNPKKAEARRKLNELERVYKNNLNQITTIFKEKRQNTYLKLAKMDCRSHSPIADHRFMIENVVTEEALSARKRQVKEFYNEHSRRALRNSINCHERKLKHFKEKSPDKQSVDFDKLSSSEIIAYHKTVLQNTKLQMIDQMRQFHF